MLLKVSVVHFWSVHVIEDYPNQVDDILSLCQPFGPDARKGLIKCKNTFKCSDVMLSYHDITKHMVTFFVQLPTKAKI